MFSVAKPPQINSETVELDPAFETDVTSKRVMPAPLTIVRWVCWCLLVLFIAALIPGMFEYAYVAYILRLWDQGVSSLEWTNPHIAKMSLAALAFIYFRFFSPNAQFVPRWLAMPLAFGAVVGFVLHLVMAVSTWNYYFDAKGQATKFYCVDKENRPHFFGMQRFNPWTGDPLTPVTAKDVNDIEARLREPFHEVFNPKTDEWFWPGNRQPRLWYSRRPDGLHLFNAPAQDDGAGTEVMPITRTVRDEYYIAQTKGRVDGNLSSYQEPQRRASPTPSPVPTQIVDSIDSHRSRDTSNYPSPRPSATMTVSPRPSDMLLTYDADGNAVYDRKPTPKPSDGVVIRHYDSGVVIRDYDRKPTPKPNDGVVIHDENGNPHYTEKWPPDPNWHPRFRPTPSLFSPSP